MASNLSPCLTLSSLVLENETAFPLERSYVTHLFLINWHWSSYVTLVSQLLTSVTYDIMSICFRVSVRSLGWVYPRLQTPSHRSQNFSKITKNKDKRKRVRWVLCFLKVSNPQALQNTSTRIKASLCSTKHFHLHSTTHQIPLYYSALRRKMQWYFTLYAEAMQGKVIRFM